MLMIVVVLFVAVILTFTIPTVRTDVVVALEGNWTYVMCPNGTGESCHFEVPYMNMSHAKLERGDACRDSEGNVHVNDTVLDLSVGDDYTTPQRKTFVGSNAPTHPLSLASSVWFTERGADGSPVKFAEVPISSCSR
ncbi:MAG TPA: hypothetical protein VHZ04_02760 [Candidatus Paceibacterota bacterium]|nr:hypothetical protein [Candidatus Paceibacterota bacterium]